MTFFDTAIIYLDSWGLTDVVLPFVLLFTVLFAILMKVGIFTEPGKDDSGKSARVPSRRFNSVIALVMSLIVVIPHVTRSYASDADPITIINTFLPGAMVIIIVLVVTLLLIGFLGGKHNVRESGLTAIIGILAMLGLAVILWRALYPYTGPTWLYWLDDPDLLGVAAAILILGLVVWYVTGDDKPKKSMPERAKELWG
jgi:hypothetical protein